jgi:peroxiredoxin family protein
MSAQPDSAALDRLIEERLDALLPKKLAELRERQTPSLCIIATKGTLDWAYPPFILSSTAAALGWNVSVFFTFYGLNLLKKDLSHLKVSPLGNPGMPMKMPFGPEWFKHINWSIPNAVQGIVPGFEAMATTLMKKTIHDKGVAGVEELRAACVEGGVNLIGCQMTVDLFGYAPEDFIPEVKEYCGAATFLPMARDADVSLFI